MRAFDLARCCFNRASECTFFISEQLTQNQYGRARRCYFLDGAAHPQHLGITRDQSGQRVRLTHRLQTVILLLQVVQAECALDRERQ
jgi:hypothetical protein